MRAEDMIPSDIELVGRAWKATWDWFAGKSVLVLGASGLIGSTFVRALRGQAQLRGFDIDVTAAGRSERRLQERFANDERIHLLRCDVSLPLDLPHSYDVIVDAASPADPASFAASPVEVMEANLTGVRHVLEQIRNQGTGMALYLSSGEIYGEFPDHVLATEDMSGRIDSMAVRSCYPSSKRAAETLCAAYHAEYGVDVRVARPAHIFGPGFTASDSRVSAAFFRDALAGENIVLRSDGMQRRTYTYVTDCVAGLLAIVVQGQAGKAYNVSNDANDMTLRDFAEIVAESAGVRCVAPDPAPAAETPVMQRASSLSGTRLRTLGWKPQISVSQGVYLTYAALAKNAANPLPEKL